MKHYHSSPPPLLDKDTDTILSRLPERLLSALRLDGF
jgi:hypothetical protein